MAPPSELVRVTEMNARIIVDLRYATSANVTGRRLYPSAEAWLHRATVRKLDLAQRGLEAERLGLKLLDAYRPPSAQRALWAWCPDPRFVAPPERGSRHTRGAAVDVTLVDAEGRELSMPSGYDEFSERAHRLWKGAPAEARRHCDRLTHALTGAGFTMIESEWWHFDDADWRQFPLLDWEPESPGAGSGLSCGDGLR